MAVSVACSIVFSIIFERGSGAIAKRIVGAKKEKIKVVERDGKNEKDG